MPSSYPRVNLKSILSYVILCTSQVVFDHLFVGKKFVLHIVDHLIYLARLKLCKTVYQGLRLVLLMDITSFLNFLVKYFV